MICTLLRSAYSPIGQTSDANALAVLSAARLGGADVVDLRALRRCDVTDTTVATHVLASAALDATLKAKIEAMAVGVVDVNWISRQFGVDAPSTP